MQSNQHLLEVFIETAAAYPQVEQVDTAIPAFIGYTETAIKLLAGDLVKEALRIDSFIEYVRHFGGPPLQQLLVTLDKHNEPLAATAASPDLCKMYYTVKNYFDNGGITCYIFSLGDYAASSNANERVYGDNTEDGALRILSEVDDITLILFPDLELLDEAGYFEVMKTALRHCATMKDRFLIMDIYDNANNQPHTSIANFRNNIGLEHLSYGAAYFPSLTSTYNHNFTNSSLTMIQPGGQFDGIVAGDLMLLIHAHDLAEVLTRSIKRLSLKNKTARLRLIAASLAELMHLVKARDILAAITEAILKVDDELKNNSGQLKEETTQVLMQLMSLFKEKANDALKKQAKHRKIKGNTASENVKYFRKKVSKAFTSKINDVINQQYVTIPASAAVAGVYAYTDRTGGVWKAPAGVSLQAVTAPVVYLSESDQSMMNANDSISVNAIRSFPARGVLVSGARTLEVGNSEWRYVSVRRYFITVEESVGKACEPFAFEPNEPSTWKTIRLMVEQFLLGQWQAGALAGTKPEQSFFVRIGLHETMTAQDMLEGRMIVEIGMAVIKPSEFIIIRLCISCMPTN
jgi:uncharacterized protein